LFSLSFLGLSACSGESSEEPHDDGHGHEGEFSLGRLTVSDAESAAVYVVDLDDGEITTVGVEAAGAYLSSDATRPHAFVAHYEGGLFEVIDTGITVTAHDDHFHVTRETPRKHDFSLSGLEPAHVVTGNDHIAVHFDGDGRVALVPYDALDGNSSADTEYVDANQPHHGVGVPFGDFFLLTHAVPATPEDEEEGWLDGVPVGVTVRAWSNPSEIQQTISGCGHLHGEAVARGAALFACDEGVLRLVEEGGELTEEVIPYPDDIDSRTWGFVHGSGDLVVGDSATRLLSVDAGAGDVSVHELPGGAARAAQAVSRDGTEVYVLDTWGELHRLAAATMSPRGEPLPVVDALSPEDRVLVTAGAGKVYVTDSRDGTIYTIDTPSWELEGEPLALPGRAFSVAITGMTGESH
jgi:hypothetical protein